MTGKVYVGNIPFNATEDEVHDLFSQYGNVKSVKLINDRDTGKSRGFCFVEMEDIAPLLNLKERITLGERELVINEARPQEKKDFSKTPRGNVNRRDDRRNDKW